MSLCDQPIGSFKSWATLVCRLPDAKLLVAFRREPVREGTIEKEQKLIEPQNRNPMTRSRKHSAGRTDRSSATPSAGSSGKGSWNPES